MTSLADSPVLGSMRWWCIPHFRRAPDEHAKNPSSSVIIPITSSRWWGFSSPTSHHPYPYISPPKSTIHLGSSFHSCDPWIMALIISRKYHLPTPPNSRITSSWSMTEASSFSTYCHPVRCPICSTLPYPSDESLPAIVGSKYPSVRSATSSAKESIAEPSSSSMACFVLLRVSSQFHSMNREYLSSNSSRRLRIARNKTVQSVLVSISMEICVPMISQLSFCITVLYRNTASCKYSVLFFVFS